MANKTIHQDEQKEKSIPERIVKIDLIIARLKDELQKLSAAMSQDNKYKSKAVEVEVLVIELGQVQAQLKYAEQITDDEQAQQNNPPFTIKEDKDDND
jgi:hypothetical protein